MKEHKWETQHWVIHNLVDKPVENLLLDPQLRDAAMWISEGEVVAFPTETVYGLGANALSDQATLKIYEAKGRPSDNPLIVHIAHRDQLVGVVGNLPGIAYKLMDSFWPGPLTLVLPKGNLVCSTVTAGLSTVAVRMPDHPLAIALITACNKPLAAPSANRSGKPSPTTAEHVLHDLYGRVAGVLDGGETGVGVESTVLDVTGEKPMILRPGGITKQQLEEVLGEVDVDPAIEKQLGDGMSEKRNPSLAPGSVIEGIASLDLKSQPKSPGVKYQHYAPEGMMWLVSQNMGLIEMRQKVQELATSDQALGYTVAILTTEEGVSSYSAQFVLSLGVRDDLSTIARQVYQKLRECDDLGVQRIYAESYPREGLGDAIMNRLLKAANGRIVDSSGI
jgi:L-threonylcarbamoyladenylate synthase